MTGFYSFNNCIFIYSFNITKLYTDYQYKYVVCTGFRISLGSMRNKNQEPFPLVILLEVADRISSQDLLAFIHPGNGEVTTM